MRYRYSVAVIAMLAAVGLPANSAFAAETAICSFLHKLLPSAANEFTEWKGAEDTEAMHLSEDAHAFHGTLMVGKGCTLYQRHLFAQEEVPPYYSCVLVEPVAMSRATGVYKKSVRDLRACFPEWNFTERKNGSPGYETWDTTAERPGFTVKIELTDLSLVSAIMANAKTYSQDSVSVWLDVTDTAPAVKPEPRE